jgi:glutamate-1-semialdehyde 2,1-aminomutase
MGAKSKALNDTLVAGLSDIRFTDTNRVPFQFQKETRARYRVASLTSASEGPALVDVDGGRAIDVSGSYGVNVAGYENYKKFVDEGWAATRDLGPNVLGPIHPVIGAVLPALKRIANKEEVSFHMSGTEAVMCAVRLCRFNTRRRLIVQFAGAYHGWWDGVQPGPGSERANADVLYWSHGVTTKTPRVFLRDPPPLTGTSRTCRRPLSNASRRARTRSRASACPRSRA